MKVGASGCFPCACFKLWNVAPVKMISTPGIPGTENSTQSIPLKKRVCDWRIIPSIVTIVVLIVKIVLVIIWNHPYAAIPSGVGIIATLFSLYWVSHFKDLKTHEENNIEQRIQIEQLKKTKDDLDASVKQLQETMGQNNEEFSKSLEQYKGALNLQNDLIKSLDEVEKALNGHTGNLDGAISNLKDILSKNSTTNEQFADAAKGIQETGRSLTKILEAFQKLDPKEMQKQRDELLQIQSNISDATEKLGTLKTQISLLESIVSDLRTQVTQGNVVIDKLQGVAIRLERSDSSISENLNLLKSPPPSPRPPDDKK